MVGSSDVAIVGAEDKRQITACVAASLRGDLLPLQLIFQGKTTRSLPSATPASTAARVDITHSANHWSTQGTMQAMEAGEFDIVSPDYREITGKPARALREFLESVRDGSKTSPH